MLGNLSISVRPSYNFGTSILGASRQNTLSPISRRAVLSGLHNTFNARSKMPPKHNPHSYTTLPPGAPAVPRPSSSLILLDSQNRILLTHRTSTIGSFANAHVFPGGTQDAEDTSPEFCAVRETFEEAGVLLTKPAPSAALIAQFPEIRKQIHSRSLKFSEFLAANNLSANVEGLVPYTTWITPPTMKKRYETKMFLGFLPLSPSQSSGLGAKEEDTTVLPTADGGVETVSAEFLTASEILSKLKAGSIILFPPQAYLITRLSRFTNDKALTLEEQRQSMVQWIANEGLGKYVFEPRPEGKTKDGRVILGYGPRGDPNRKSVLKFGKGGMPGELEIVDSQTAAKLAAKL